MSRLEARIIRHEGFSPLPYADTLGNQTVGYGFALASGFTAEECLAVLRIRIKNLTESVSYAIPFFTRLSQARQDVLVEMAYNMGLPNLLGFKMMLLALGNGDYSKAAEEMLDSGWHDQVGVRAERLAQIMAEG